MNESLHIKPMPDDTVCDIHAWPTEGLARRLIDVSVSHRNYGRRFGDGYMYFDDLRVGCPDILYRECSLRIQAVRRAIVLEGERRIKEERRDAERMAAVGQKRG